MKGTRGKARKRSGYVGMYRRFAKRMHECRASGNVLGAATMGVELIRLWDYALTPSEKRRLRRGEIK